MKSKDFDYYFEIIIKCFPSVSDLKYPSETPPKINDMFDEYYYDSANFDYYYRNLAHVLRKEEVLNFCEQIFEWGSIETDIFKIYYKNGKEYSISDVIEQAYYKTYDKKYMEIVYNYVFNTVYRYYYIYSKRKLLHSFKKGKNGKPRGFYNRYDVRCHVKDYNKLAKSFCKVKIKNPRKYGYYGTLGPSGPF